MGMENTGEQLQSAQSSEQNHPISSPPSHKTGNLLIPVGVVIAILVAGFGAYFLGARNNQGISQPQTANSSKSSPPTTQVTPTTTTETTNNWKSKTTELLSLKYPADWEESQDKVTGGYTLLKPINNDKVWVGVNDYTYINQSETPEQLAKQALGNETPVNKKQITVDGYSAVYQERHYPDSVRIEVYVGDVKEMTEFTAQDGGPRLTNGTHSLFMEIRDLAQLEASRATLNQILSTFKYSR